MRGSHTDHLVQAMQRIQMCPTFESVETLTVPVTGTRSKLSLTVRQGCCEDLIQDLRS